MNVTHFAWSPHEDRLVATADAHQRDEYVYERADLWLVSLEGESPKLVDHGKLLYVPPCERVDELQRFLRFSCRQTFEGVRHVALELVDFVVPVVRHTDADCIVLSVEPSGGQAR